MWSAIDLAEWEGRSFARTSITAGTSATPAACTIATSVIPNGEHKGDRVDEPEYEGWSARAGPWASPTASPVAWLNTQDRSGVRGRQRVRLGVRLGDGGLEKGWLTPSRWASTSRGVTSRAPNGSSR